MVGPVCEKAWIYERVPGFELAGYDDRHSDQKSLILLKYSAIWKYQNENLTKIPFNNKAQKQFFIPFLQFVV